MTKYFMGFLCVLWSLSSCEEVIDLELDSANPAFVAEAIIFKDSVCHVRLSLTNHFFSEDEPEYIEDAVIYISDGLLTEQLNYTDNGNYKGTSILGREETGYSLEIHHNNTVYTAYSRLPKITELGYVNLYKGNDVSPLNPLGETVITIECHFMDDPASQNYYMLRFVKEGKLLDEAFYLLTENDSNVGSFRNENNTLIFGESIFYDGEGEVDVQLFSVDEAVFNYFWQLNDILFWKRRIMPPTPNNPKSNFSNGALGYFAAWGFDSGKVTIK